MKALRNFLGILMHYLHLSNSLLRVCLLAFPLYRWSNWAQGGEHAPGDRISNKEGGCEMHAIHLSLPSFFTISISQLPSPRRSLALGRSSRWYAGYRSAPLRCHVERTVETVWKLDGESKSYTRCLEVVDSQDGTTEGLRIKCCYKSCASGRLTWYI